jgi:hypothetical protein
MPIQISRLAVRRACGSTRRRLLRCHRQNQWASQPVLRAKRTSCAFGQLEVRIDAADGFHGVDLLRLVFGGWRPWLHAKPMA